MFGTPFVNSAPPGVPAYRCARSPVLCDSFKLAKFKLLTYLMTRLNRTRCSQSVHKWSLRVLSRRYLVTIVNGQKHSLFGYSATFRGTAVAGGGRYCNSCSCSGVLAMHRGDDVIEGQRDLAAGRAHRLLGPGSVVQTICWV
jgi:hypothetical protein